jgi:beta-xylosidase
VLFNTNDHGAYVSRAANVAGPWTVNALNVKLYDPGLFFEDDGTVWVVSGQNTLTLTELSADLMRVKSPPRTIFVGHHYDEGSHVYKRNGFYYILNATSRSDLPTRFALQIERSRSLAGPFESRIIFTDDANWRGWALHQGGFVTTPQGAWWAILFQDRYDFGREPMLQPVEWVNDWPVIGDHGQAVITYKKPDVEHPTPPVEMVRSDDFDGPILAGQWEWNHNPDNSKWSLTERPGFLRLKTASVTQSWLTARNTLWQRLVEGGKVMVTAKLDVRAMREGDVAGLGIFQRGTSSIGVTDDSARKIVVRNQDSIVATHSLRPAEVSVWLRLQVPDLQAETQYSFSLDGEHFVTLGKPQPMFFHSADMWIGERIALFNYATRALGGHVDIDSFVYDTPNRTNLLSAVSRIEAQRYDVIAGGHLEWIADPLVVNGKPLREGGSYQRAASDFERGGWLKFERISFPGGATSVLLNFAADSGTKVELHLDSPQGPLVANCSLNATGVTEQFETKACPAKDLTGVHPIYLVFPDGADHKTRLAWFQFDKAQSYSVQQHIDMSHP